MVKLFQVEKSFIPALFLSEERQEPCFVWRLYSLSDRGWAMRQQQVGSQHPVLLNWAFFRGQQQLHITVLQPDWEWFQVTKSHKGKLFHVEEAEQLAEQLWNLLPSATAPPWDEMSHLEVRCLICDNCLDLPCSRQRPWKTGNWKQQIWKWGCESHIWALVHFFQCPLMMFLHFAHLFGSVLVFVLFFHFALSHLCSSWHFLFHFIHAVALWPLSQKSQFWLAMLFATKMNFSICPWLAPLKPHYSLSSL